jgi:hypothetical protein
MTPTQLRTTTQEETMNRTITVTLPQWGTLAIEYRPDQRAYQITHDGLHKDWCSSIDEATESLASAIKAHLNQTLTLV